MLNIIVPGMEYFDEDKEEFIYTSDTPLQLEHSLVSISKWEAEWQKPFLDGKDKTIDEIISYIRCMVVNNVEDEVYDRLTENNLISINKYIENPMSATTFNDNNKTNNREIITSELIYYWLVSYNIPFECQYWHLNRLLTLIRVCNIKNNPPKKMSKQEILSRNKALNKQRREQFNSKG